MLGNRPSSLPIARYCGLAPRLGEQHGAGDSARLSHAFHGLCAGTLEPGEWERLTDEEQAMLKSWKKPGDVQPAKGPLLTYEAAHKEIRLAVDEQWNPFIPGSHFDETVFIEGTADFLWVVDARDGTRVVFVGDIKRTKWAALGGVYSLQLLCYCWMACAAFNADAYCPGIWLPEDGEWQWAEKVYRVESPEALRHLEQVEAAARNKGDAIMGPHCSHCYQRKNCPEYMAPVTEGDLAPALNGSLTPENGLIALQALKRLEDQVAAAKDNIKAAVKQGLRIYDPKAKKVWRHAFKKGRESFNQKLAKQELGEETFNRYVTRGPDTEEFRWVKA